jgi:dipeptidyl aminopeptidase/acylaminoacyl peptidase
MPGQAIAGELPLELFAKLPLISSPKLSPDGEYLAMIQPYNGREHLFIQRINGQGQPVIVPPRGKFEINWPAWANNERLLISIIYQGWRGGTPTTETRLMAATRDGSNMKFIVQQKRDKSAASGLKKTGVAQFQDHIVSFLRNDPDHFLLSVDGDSDGSYELRRVDVHSGNFSELYSGFRGIQKWMADQQGNPRLGWGVDTQSAAGAGDTRRRFFRYRHADGEFIDFKGSKIYQQGFTLLGFAENPDHAYMSGPGQYGTRVIAKYDLRQEEFLQIFEHRKYDAVGMIHDAADGTPVGVRFAGDADPVIFEPAWAKRYSVINRALPNTRNLIVSSNDARSLHLILSSSDTDSGVYYSFDETTKRISQFALLYDGLDPAEMSPMKRVSYEARDGLTIPAILTLPLDSDGKNLASVVLPHGGPQSRSSIGFHYWVQFLTNRGYAVLQPNFRGSTGYGKAFREAGYGQWGLKMQDDVTDGTRWLIEQGIADPKRICIVGGSYGGYAALMGVAKEPDLYRCAVSLNGVANIPDHMRSKRKYIGGALGTDHINQEGQRDVSPELLVDAIKAPVLLVAAKDDRTVDYRQSKDMAKALKRAKNKYKYVEMEEGDHSLTTEESRRIFLTEMERFLKKHLH